MQVLETPGWGDWPVSTLGSQRYGHFVLLRVDTQASVADLDDEEATRAAALLPQDWFLGIIMATDMGTERKPDGSFKLNFRFSLVGTGPPDPAHESIAIAPAPPITESRPALVLSPPLPWPNLYVYTYDPPGGIISRVHYSSGLLATCLSPEVLSEVDDAVIRDNYDRGFIELAAAARKAQESCNAEAEPVEDDDDDESLNELDLVSLDDDMQARLDRVRVFVELAFDPALCPEAPASPAGFKEQAARIEDIWDEWEDRKLREVVQRRRQKTADWTRGIEGLREDPWDESLQPVDFDEPLSDEAVLPEDAVDNLVGRRGPSRASSFISTKIRLPSPSDVVNSTSGGTEPIVPEMADKPADLPMTSPPAQPMPPAVMPTVSASKGHEVAHETPVSVARKVAPVVTIPNIPNLVSIIRSVYMRIRSYLPCAVRRTAQEG